MCFAFCFRNFVIWLVLKNALFYHLHYSNYQNYKNCKVDWITNVVISNNIRKQKRNRFEDDKMEVLNKNNIGYYFYEYVLNISSIWNNTKNNCIGIVLKWDLIVLNQFCNSFSIKNSSASSQKLLFFNICYKNNTRRFIFDQRKNMFKITNLCLVDKLSYTFSFSTFRDSTSKNDFLLTQLILETVLQFPSTNFTVN